MNNTKSEKSKRFNIIDFIIIVGIIAAIGFCVTILTGNMFSNKIVNVRYCVKLEGVEADAKDTLKEGMRIYSTEMNIPVGVVKSTATENMTITSFDHSTNRFITNEQEGLYTMYLYMNAGCIFEDGCYHTENLRLSENTQIDINLPFAYDSAEIISVKPVYGTENK